MLGTRAARRHARDRGRRLPGRRGRARRRPLAADHRRAARRRHRALPPARPRGPPSRPRTARAAGRRAAIVLAVSRLVPRKGFDTAIRAIAELSRILPDVVLADRRSRPRPGPARRHRGDDRRARALPRPGSPRRPARPVRLRRRVRHAVPQPVGRARAGGLRHRVRRGRRGGGGPGRRAQRAVPTRPSPTARPGWSSTTRPMSHAVADALRALLDRPCAARADGRGGPASGPSRSSPTTCSPNGSVVQWARCHERFARSPTAATAPAIASPTSRPEPASCGSISLGTVVFLVVGVRSVRRLATSTPPAIVVVVSVVCSPSAWPRSSGRSSRRRAQPDREIGVANLYLLTGPTAPPRVRSGSCSAASVPRRSAVSSFAAVGFSGLERRRGQPAGVRDPRADVRSRAQRPVGVTTRSLRAAYRLGTGEIDAAVSPRPTTIWRRMPAMAESASQNITIAVIARALLRRRHRLRGVPRVGQGREGGRRAGP